MKILVFEDDQEDRQHIADMVQAAIKGLHHNFELYLSTDDSRAFKKAVERLDETAIFLIDIVHGSLPLGIDMVLEISKRKKSDFVIIITNHAEKFIYRPDIKVHIFSVVFKKLQGKSDQESHENLAREIAFYLSYIDEIIKPGAEANMLCVSLYGSSILRIPERSIVFIETYSKNRIRIHYDKNRVYKEFKSYLLSKGCKIKRYDQCKLDGYYRPTEVTETYDIVDITKPVIIRLNVK